MLEFEPFWKLGKDKDAKPVYNFEEEGGEGLLEQRLRYWQHVLNLDHWIIEAKLVDEIENPCDDDRTVLGINYTSPENCYAQIAIAKGEPPVGRRFDELTLVHELMHCVIPLFGVKDETYLECVGGVYTERQVELIARTLMKVKYGLEMEDFYKQPSVNNEGSESE